MKYPEIFQTVSIETVNSGEVEMPHMGAAVFINVDDRDDTVMLTIDQQWFCRHDLLELASILARIAGTLPVEEE